MQSKNRTLDLIMIVAKLITDLVTSILQFPLVDDADDDDIAAWVCKAECSSGAGITGGHAPCELLTFLVNLLSSCCSTR